MSTSPNFLPPPSDVPKAIFSLPPEIWLHISHLSALPSPPPSPLTISGPSQAARPAATTSPVRSLIRNAPTRISLSAPSPIEYNPSEAPAAGGGGGGYYILPPNLTPGSRPLTPLGPITPLSIHGHHTTTAGSRRGSEDLLSAFTAGGGGSRRGSGSGPTPLSGNTSTAGTGTGTGSSGVVIGAGAGSAGMIGGDYFGSWGRRLDGFVIAAVPPTGAGLGPVAGVGLGGEEVGPDEMPTVEAASGDNRGVADQGARITSTSLGETSVGAETEAGAGAEGAIGGAGHEQVIAGQILRGTRTPSISLDLAAVLVPQGEINLDEDLEGGVNAVAAEGSAVSGQANTSDLRGQLASAASASVARAPYPSSRTIIPSPLLFPPFHPAAHPQNQNQIHTQAQTQLLHATSPSRSESLKTLRALSQTCKSLRGVVWGFVVGRLRVDWGRVCEMLGYGYRGNGGGGMGWVDRKGKGRAGSSRGRGNRGSRGSRGSGIWAGVGDEGGVGRLRGYVRDLEIDIRPSDPYIASTTSTFLHEMGESLSSLEFRFFPADSKPPEGGTNGLEGAKGGGMRSIGGRGNAIYLPNFFPLTPTQSLSIPIFPNLQRLTLTSPSPTLDPSTITGLHPLPTILAHCPGLVELDLRGCELGLEGVVGLMDVIRSRSDSDLRRIGGVAGLEVLRVGVRAESGGKGEEGEEGEELRLSLETILGVEMGLAGIGGGIDKGTRSLRVLEVESFGGMVELDEEEWSEFADVIKTRFPRLQELSLPLRPSEENVEIDQACCRAVEALLGIESGLDGGEIDPLDTGFRSSGISEGLEHLNAVTFKTSSKLELSYAKNSRTHNSASSGWTTPFSTSLNMNIPTLGADHQLGILVREDGELKMVEVGLKWMGSVRRVEGGRRGRERVEVEGGMERFSRRA